MAAWLAATSMLFVWPDEDSPSRASAIVVLAGSKKPRLSEGLRLMRAGVAPVLAISDGRDPGWPEANRLCDGEASFRVICFDAEPFSTRGEAETVTRLAAENGWRSLVVVTSAYHVTRARLLFERCFLGPVQFVGAHIEPGALPLTVPSEWAKLIYALAVAREC